MKFNKISDYIWEVPTSYKEGMRVPARIYATEELLPGFDEKVIDQITNVATLPGIQKHALCMPDGHMGYGFPIGGVAAFDPEEDGIISPGGIGFDINCGMRLVTTNLTWKDVQPKIKDLMNHLFKTIPAGVGRSSLIRLRPNEFKDVVEQGAKYCIEKGWGWEEDLERIEDHGRIDWADVSKVSTRALQRGLNQLGTLGSGNHYLEVQTVSKEDIFDERLAKKFGINQPDQVVIMFHCGSRGFGHQIGTDYLKSFLGVMPKYNIKVLDRELACAPFNSEEGQDYYKAMACGANMAFANRQVILHHLRQGFQEIFKTSPEDLGMSMVYDVAHNIAKLEKHKIDGVNKELIVHRKGSTRCFGPSRPELPKLYADSGQPVIVGGSMETGSYLCVGTDKAEETFGSTMHGAGRTMSRTAAKKQIQGQALQQKMEKQNIYVKAVSMSGLAEEAGFAYKNVASVVDVMDKAGISKKVLALRPKGNIKG